MNWKSLINNPPAEDCLLCIRFEYKEELDKYGLYAYHASDNTMRCITSEYPHFSMPDEFCDCEPFYINLNEIKK